MEGCCERQPAEGAQAREQGVLREQVFLQGDWGAGGSGQSTSCGSRVGDHAGSATNVLPFAK